MIAGALCRAACPPALKAFEAASRHESFTRAAEGLCVTLGPDFQRNSTGKSPN